MGEANALPFDRGCTASNWGQITPDDSTWSQLEGKIVKVLDTVHGTGGDTLLRIVKNDSGADITVARKFMGFSTASDYDYGRRVSGFAGAGAPCKPLDDAYNVGDVIPDDDLFYVIEEGYATVKTEASAVDLPAGAAVVSDASGFVDGVMAAYGSGFAAGMIGPATTTTESDIAVCVFAGLQRPGT